MTLQLVDIKGRFGNHSFIISYVIHAMMLANEQWLAMSTFIRAIFQGYQQDRIGLTSYQQLVVDIKLPFTVAPPVMYSEN